MGSKSTKRGGDGAGADLINHHLPTSFNGINNNITIVDSIRHQKGNHQHHQSSTNDIFAYANATAQHCSSTSFLHTLPYHLVRSSIHLASSRIDSITHLFKPPSFILLCCKTNLLLAFTSIGLWLCSAIPKQQQTVLRLPIDGRQWHTSSPSLFLVAAFSPLRIAHTLPSASSFTSYLNTPF